MINLDPNRERTHVVLDLMYTESEGQVCYSGTEQDCIDYISEQSKEDPIGAKALMIGLKL